MPSQKDQENRRHCRRAFTRRQFLCRLGATVAGLAVAGCSTETGVGTATTVPASAQVPVPTLTPTPLTLPTGTPEATPASTPTATAAGPRARVAVAQVPDYDPALVRLRLETMLDGIGGLGDVISPGDRVALKVNLTGGTGAENWADAPAVESYATHPHVAQALGELLRDAGAGELFIVEAVYGWDSYRLWGYEEVATAVGATLIDLNAPDPYADFNSVPVGQGWFTYDSFIFNRLLQEVDAFISVAKMKCHWCCGVTHALKNLIGLVPVHSYTLTEGDGYRKALHGPGDAFKTRLPGVILDLNRARPIDLALIDGIKTAEGGEGPWHPGFASVQPGVLIAGKDPVAADAVATAVMGFDPTTSSPTAPFLRAGNYLNMAAGLGLGTNRLSEIDVAGARVDDVRYPFEPCWD